ncbi:MAG: dTDP-glucose 4,6-dehydratase [Verrucomicrobia subdivision 3 bacterium]|nr:dTDP-glucose 4,6-dehydratase [Limisphaerales bacterium]MCS1416289.1 dTDP-glucose 4,6-dehydratase [Limisphaerales bacterium]
MGLLAKTLDSKLSSVRFERIFRGVADSLMLVGSLALAFLVRLSIVYWIDRPSDLDSYIQEYVRTFLKTSWFLLLLGISVFSIFGFYIRGRNYRGRYKALVVFQAVAVVYLLFSFASFIMPSLFGVPRGVLVIGWLVAAVILVASRLWSSLWRMVIREELRNEVDLGRGAEADHVLVIGGAGYIGSALLPKLLEAGYRVRLLDAFLFGEEPIKEFVGHERLEIIKGDFRQVDKVVEAMRGVGLVVHLGGLVGDLACAHDEGLTIEINLAAVRLIADVAKAHKVERFIFASTCSVYGANDVILDERSMLDPVSLYASSKIASEKVLHEVSDESFKPIIVRFGTIYGFSGRIRFDLVVNLLTAKAVREGRITLFGGEQWRPFVHVDDAAKGVLSMLMAPGELVNGEVFNVGSDGQNYTLEQVGRKIQEIVPSAEIVDMGNDSDRRNYRVSFAKIRERLQFEPSWTLEAGIAQVKESLESGVIEDYTESRYSNARTIFDEKASRLLRGSGWEKRLIQESMPGRQTGSDRSLG